jgi:hypothetical protein
LVTGDWGLGSVPSHPQRLILLYGGDRFVIDRAAEGSGGRYASLLVDEICMGVEVSALRRVPGEAICDVGFAVISGVVSLLPLSPGMS